MKQQHRGGRVTQLLLLISLILCRAFAFVGIRINKKNSSPSGTPRISKMTFLSQNSVNAEAKTFDLDQWQAGKISSFSQTCFAEYWDDLLSIQDFGAVDPYNFFHRMALNKALIQETGGESIWGTNEHSVYSCSQHPIWGYAAQLDWQRRSGRFQDPSKWQDESDGNALLQKMMNDNDKNSGTISKQSWWGYMNLQFSVAMYCGAAEVGLVPQITWSDESVWSDAGFLKCVDIWKEFWESYKSTFLPSISNCSNKIEDEDLKDELYRTLWKAHTGIIQAGVSHGKGLEGILPQHDRDAGLGWCNMVELLAATNWPLLSLDNLCKFGCGYLPIVRLGGPKTFDWLKHHRKLEYTTVQSLYQLKNASSKAMSGACLLFGRVAKWRFAVKKLPRTLHVLTHGNPIQKMLALSRVMLLAVFPRSLLERGVALAVVSLVGMGKITKAKRIFGY